MSIAGILSGPDFPEAQCKGMYDKFFPTTTSPNALHKQLSECKAICNSCIHKVECRDYSRTIPNNWGFWGGELVNQDLTPPQIRQRRAG